MKKFSIILIAVISAILICLSFVACSVKDKPINVAGKTFVFESYDVTYSDDVADEDKMTQERIDEIVEAYRSMNDMVLNDDGTIEWGSVIRYYVQNGKIVNIYYNEEDLQAGKAQFVARVEGKKIIIPIDDGAGTVTTIIYKNK